MRNRIFAVLAIAILAGGGLAYGTYNLVQNQPQKTAAIATQPVVVAAADLQLGAELKKEDLTVVNFPAGQAPEGTFSQAHDLIGRGLIVSVVKNEPILTGKLASKEAGAGLPPTITAGMRAISVKVNEVIGVAGFVVPGTRVDVVVTLSKQHDSVSRVVVTNAQVLTAGTKYDQEQAKDGKPVPSTVVTLLVMPEDAERIALASTEGSIMLTLRNPLDTEPTMTSGTRMASLMGAPDPPPVTRVVSGVRRVQAPVVAAPVAAPTIYSVETIRAAKRGQEVVK